MRLFGHRPTVSVAERDWIEDNLDWAIDEGILRADTPLVLLTPAFFTARRGADDHETALGVFEDLRHLLHLSDVPIDLVALRTLPVEYRHEVGALSATAGTWQGDPDHSLIEYDPALVAEPLGLIALLVHELMHHVLAHASSDPPGGPEAEELNTDLHCIAAGFGAIHLAHGEAAGWSGYMTTDARAYALALFLAVRDLAPAMAEPFLCSRTRRALRRAVTDLSDRGERVEALRARLSGH